MNNESSLPVKTQAYLALAAICIIWGTTYTAIKFAVRDFPPFLLVGIRQTTAGLILLLIAYLSGKITPVSNLYLRRQALTGLAIIAGGNGFITWGMRFVPSGLSSVIGSLTPVLVALFALLWKDNKEKMSKLTILGVLTGFIGMGLVFSDGWADFLNPDYRWGIAGCFASCCTWSLGTVMSKRYNDHQVSPLMNAGLQITTGGFGGFILSALFDTTHKIHHTSEGWIAVSYLILIGSALAFTLYMFVLKHLNVTISSLYTYINPIVAILLGWLLLGESFTWLELFGIAVTIFGVWLVNKGAR